MRVLTVGDIIVYHSLGLETSSLNSSIVMPTVNDKDKTSELDECYLCQTLTDSTCPQCGLASCPHHLSSHLNSDNVCLPFIIKYKEGVGRYVVASRDIKPNEVSPHETQFFLLFSEISDLVILDSLVFSFPTKTCNIF